MVLGYPYAMSIDVWSLGCVAAELFLGLPLFPGACEHDLLGRMISTLGPLPDFLLTSGRNARKFFSVQEEVVQDPLTGAWVVWAGRDVGWVGARRAACRAGAIAPRPGPPGLRAAHPCPRRRAAVAPALPAAHAAAV